MGPDGAPSATLQRRVRAACSFGGTSARYMPTGGAHRQGRSEARVMADLLIARGVAPEHIELEETATDTLSSALACARLLRPRLMAHRTDVYAASSFYHLPRCLLLLRMAGIPAKCCPPPPFRLEAYWWAREAAALPWDAWLLWRHNRGRLP